MSISKKVLITEEFHPLIEEGFTQLGYEVDNIWEIDTAGVKAIIQNYEILIINSKIKVDKSLLENANKLKVIARVGSGLEIIDLEECQKRNIHVISTPEGNANAVAEHTLAFILSAFNNLYKSQNEILQHQWIREGNRGIELSGKTLGIIGCGNNGSQLVNILAGFDTEILIYDIVDISSKITNPKARQVISMQEIFDQVDILSLHIPLNIDTEYLVNSEFLHKFKKNIYLINTSRGKICKQADIINELKSGKIIKAMLDVFENEPFVSDESITTLINENRLFLSPHIAGWTFESKKRMAEMVISKFNGLNFF